MRYNLPLCTLLIGLYFVLPAQTTTHSFSYGGQTRNYRLHLPPNFNSAQQLPLVLNLHGLGSNGQQQELYTLFNNVADTARIIAVYPDAINNQWNIQGSGTPDDVGFLSALIDTIHKNYNIDLGRVYSIGMSMGGYMSFTLACKLSCRIAAIASVTGLLNPNPTMTCNLNRKVPAVQIHGTNDPTVAYSGVAATISSWLSKNNCPTTPVVTNYPNTNTTDGCTATENYYGLCSDSAIVIQITINQGAHTWPDANPLVNIGVANRDFNANRLIWNFLNKYSTKANLTISGLATSYCSSSGAVTLSGSPIGGTFSGNGVSGNQFSPSVAGSGTHQVTYSFTQGGCTYTTRKQVVVLSEAAASISGLISPYCLNGNALSLTGVPAGGNFMGPGISGNQFNPGVAGLGTHTISYSVTDNSNCTWQTQETVQVENCTGVDELALFGQIDVFPNPAYDVLYVQYTLAEALPVSLRIFEVSGKSIVTYTTEGNNAGKFEVDTRAFAPGFYYIEIQTGGQSVLRKVSISSK